MVRKIRQHKSWRDGLEMKEVCESEWYWCLHCERVWLGAQWNENKGHCPTELCDGGPFDVQAWPDCMARRAHVEYPEFPVVGQVYPLY